MSTTTDTSGTDAPSVSAAEKPRAKFHWGFFALLILAAAAILWGSGALRPEPRIVIVTSDQPYWDLVIRGARRRRTSTTSSSRCIAPRRTSIPRRRSSAIWLTTSFAGIAVSPIDPAAEAAVLAEVAARHTLVTFDSDSPSSSRLCFVGTDNYAAGRLCGQKVREALPDGGEVIISIGNLDKENGQRRRQGVIDELLDRPFKPDQEMDASDATALKGPQHTVVTTLIDGNDANKAVEIIAAALQANPNVKCLVGLNAYSTPAILKALEQSGKLGKVKVVGFDNHADTLAGIEQDNVFATVVQDQFGCGFHAVRILAENARGDRSGLPMFQRRTLPVEVVTKENVTGMQKEIAQAPK